jgi:hypothetical protein
MNKSCIFKVQKLQESQNLTAIRNKSGNKNFLRPAKFLNILCLFGVFVLCSCSSTSKITKQYIKTNIDKHHVNSSSRSQMIKLLKFSKLELTCYMNENEKMLVIGAKKRYRSRRLFREDITTYKKYTYVQLTPAECQQIIDQSMILKERITKEKPKEHEEIFYEYTVSNDLFISYRKSTYINNPIMDLWIDGNKYSIATTTLVSKLKKFLQMN